FVCEHVDVQRIVAKLCTHCAKETANANVLPQHHDRVNHRNDEEQNGGDDVQNKTHYRASIWVRMSRASFATATVSMSPSSAFWSIIDKAKSKPVRAASYCSFSINV